MLDKLRIKITIMASLIITVYCFFSQENFLKTGYSIIFTIVVFYLFGGFMELELKAYIQKIAFRLQDNLDLSEDYIEKTNDFEKDNLLEDEINEDIDFSDEKFYFDDEVDLVEE